ncbi:MAG: hypothetical protein OJF52_004265 [Nitrospira sp.]|nr:MAG: hypothetical protein OJF52_004265 [Nitrospira sp.]
MRHFLVKKPATYPALLMDGFHTFLCSSYTHSVPLASITGRSFHSMDHAVIA